MQIIRAVAAVAVLIVLGASPSSVRAIRFDELVRDDFFAGFGGDRIRLDHAMRISEEALAVNPDHAPALVWHGAGLVFRSGEMFRAAIPRGRSPSSTAGSRRWTEPFASLPTTSPC